MQQEKQQKIIEEALKKDMLIDQKAILLLEKTENWEEILDELQKEKIEMITEKILEPKLGRTKIAQNIKKIEIQQTNYKPIAKDYTHKLKKRPDLEVTNQSCGEGTVQDFLTYFREKFKVQKELLLNRPGFNPRELKDLYKVKDKDDVELIGMVNKKWVTKNGHTALLIEDLTTSCIALVMKKETKLLEHTERILNDNVIGLKGTKLGKDFIIIKEIFEPEMPMQQPKLIEEDINLASITDVHIGSKLFLEKPFQKFIEWINGKNLTDKQKEFVGKIKYLTISGDNVDGVGIYPGQFEELAIPDIYNQYEAFTQLIEQIPEYIEIIICPGNHDAVRRAEPQPALTKKLAPRLHEFQNVTLIGSPGWVEIEGLKTMLYHGTSIHDLISSVSFLKMDEPEKGMIELLKKRHLMPSYGLRNPYAPEKVDYLAIKEKPDLIYNGDVHHIGYGNYRGTTIINSGTWQSTTPFQIKIGHLPTPGIVPVLNLKTRQLTATHFYREEKTQNIEVEEK